MPILHHGFCFPERGPAYHEESAEQVWGIVFDLYKRKLSRERIPARTTQKREAPGLNPSGQGVGVEEL